MDDRRARCRYTTPLIGEAGRARRAYPRRTGGCPAGDGGRANLAMVEEAVRMVRDCGGEPASAADMRSALGARPSLSENS